MRSNGHRKACSFSPGTAGTGKSTELKRLKARLEESGYLVFLCDVEDYLNLSTPIDVSDFLMVAAGAFGEAVNERLEKDGHRLHEGYWERFRTFWGGLGIEDPKFSASIGTGPVSVGIRGNLKNTPLFKEQLQKHMAGRLGALVADVRKFFEGCVMTLRRRYGDREIVLLLDSIEHVRGTLADAEDVYGSVEELFAGHSEKLHLPSLHVVYTVPPYLKVRCPGMGSLYGPGGIQGPAPRSGSAPGREGASRRASTPWSGSSAVGGTGGGCSAKIALPCIA